MEATRDLLFLPHFVAQVMSTISVGRPEALSPPFLRCHSEPSSRALSSNRLLVRAATQSKNLSSISTLVERSRFQIAAFRNRNAFVITETELKLIAAAAIIGLSKSPKNG